MLLCLLAPRGCPAAVDPVVAQRGADHITLSQARAIIGSLDPDARAALDAPDAITDLLRRVLMQRAVLVQARAQHWDRRPEVAALAEQARDLAVAQCFLAAQAAIPADYPTMADIVAAYEQNKSRLMQPRLYHLEQLFMPAAGPGAAETRPTLAQLGHRLTEPHSLHDLLGQDSAIVYADLGWLPEARISPDIRPLVRGLQEGAATDPVCTPAGYHLLRLVATRPAAPAPLADTRATLVHALREQRQAAAERAYANALLARQPVHVNIAELAELAAR